MSMLEIGETVKRVCFAWISEEQRSKPVLVLVSSSSCDPKPPHPVLPTTTCSQSMRRAALPTSPPMANQNNRQVKLCLHEIAKVLHYLHLFTIPH